MESRVEWHFGFDHLQEGQNYRKHRRGYLSRGRFIKRCAGLRQVVEKTCRPKKLKKRKETTKRNK